MATFLPDTSCLIAALCAWHVHHAAVRGEVDRRLRAGESMVASAHALAEAYAVLTRLPPPYRLAPQIAFRLLDENLGACKICDLQPASLWKLLRQLSSRGTGGGRTYDAIIASAAAAAGVSCILTLNERDFSSVAPPGLRIVRPVH